MSMSNLTTMNADAANRPGGLGPANPLVDTTGRFNRLQQAFQGQLKGLANEFYKMYHKALVLTDTVRTDAEQAQAHRAKPRLALPAGSPYAMHPKGLAVDTDVGESKMITPEMLAHHGSAPAGPVQGRNLAYRTGIHCLSLPRPPRRLLFGKSGGIPGQVPGVHRDYPGGPRDPGWSRGWPSSRPNASAPTP